MFAKNRYPKQSHQYMAQKAIGEKERISMTVREREQSSTLTDSSVCFQLMLTYRIPMRVEDAVGPRDDIYYRCPRCQRLLEREFLAYCSTCGQCLDWHSYRKAKRTHFHPK